MFSYFDFIKMIYAILKIIKKKNQKTLNITLKIRDSSNRI